MSPLTRPIRILCVDDNKDSADSLVSLLTIYGYDALACYEGWSALAAVENECPDACLLDLNMPGMDGDELAIKIQEQLPNCHIVFVALTAQDSAASIERTRKAGFRYHLVKPVSPDALLVALAPLDIGRAATLARKAAASRQKTQPSGPLDMN